MSSRFVVVVLKLKCNIVDGVEGRDERGLDVALPIRRFKFSGVSEMTPFRVRVEDVFLISVGAVLLGSDGPESDVSIAPNPK